MMAEYLTAAQRAQLEAQLGGEVQVSPEQAGRALQQGMRMAQADQASQEEARLLAGYGFESVQELAEAYRNVSAAVEELRGMLRRLLDMEKAAQNAEMMDPRDPERAGRYRMDELESMRRELRQAARNRLIQKDWQDSALEMQNLERLLPEMAEYILRNPRYAQESDGLMRAYDAVRSAKYRDEESMLTDPEFVERMAGDERVREAVIKEHLGRILRGEQVPQSVGMGVVGGKTPMTGRKPISGMKQAHARLSAMLGVDMGK